MPTCEHCGHETPDETFCTWCGAHRVAGIRRSRRRPHHFAAFPGEHVAQPAVITTLFPHLPGHRVHEFRWALLGGVVVDVVLVATGLVGAAILLSAVLVPVLYLVYLYEAQVYRDEPATVLGLTIVAGGLIGAAVVIVANMVIPATSPFELRSATGVLVLSTVVLPIIEEALKPLPTLPLRRRPAFAQTIDGLTFGVAAGLGFAMAETLVDFSRIIAYEPLHSASGDWLYPMASLAVLTPLMQASCTGAVVASLWRPSPRGASRRLSMLGIPVAVLGHVAFSLGSALLATHGVNPAVVLVWQAVIVVALLVYIRFLVHGSLLDEAESLGYRPAACPSCRRTVEGEAFCPHCGAAFAAGPRTSHGGLRSDKPAPVGGGGPEDP